MDKLFQHSTIGALMDGHFEGTFSVDELLQKGTLGIGTLDGLDGELIILEAKPYQIKVDGKIYELTGKEKTPYAAVTYFKGENSFTVENGLSYKETKNEVIKHFSSKNAFQAVKITGTFKNIHCRSVEKQEKPYPRLVEAAQNQTEFKRDSIQGTLLGFYTPEVFGSISVPGFHWHFLADDKDFGGHVFEFYLKEGRIEWQTMETLEQHFPVENKVFMESSIDYSTLKEDIEEAE